MVDLRRLISILTLIFGAFLVTPVFAAPNAGEFPEPNTLPAFPKDEEIILIIDGKAVPEADKREVILNDFLETKSSPLKAFTPEFIQAADKYGLDYRFLPAIAGLESSWGEILPPGSHNPFGWGPSIHFTSFAEAIETVAQGIRQRYVINGKVTPEMVGPKYAASPTWSSRVTHFMLQISDEPL